MKITFLKGTCNSTGMTPSWTQAEPGLLKPQQIQEFWLANADAFPTEGFSRTPSRQSDLSVALLPPWLPTLGDAHKLRNGRWGKAASQTSIRDLWGCLLPRAWKLCWCLMTINPKDLDSLLLRRGQDEPLEQRQFVSLGDLPLARQTPEFIFTRSTFASSKSPVVCFSFPFDSLIFAVAFIVPASKSQGKHIWH